MKYLRFLLSLFTVEQSPTPHLACHLWVRTSGRPVCRRLTDTRTERAARSSGKGGARVNGVRNGATSFAGLMRTRRCARVPAFPLARPRQRDITLVHQITSAIHPIVPSLSLSAFHLHPHTLHSTPFVVVLFCSRQ